MSLPRNILETSQADIQRLIADHVQEGAHIDFKRELPAAWDSSAKHELLADVTAFANSGGGDIVYGVSENESAEASAICPLELSSVDQEVRRLQDFILNLAEPRLPGVQVQAVSVNESGKEGHVLVVRVPQSWASPHRVKTNQHVYVREGLRKRPLDVPELRALFVRSETQAQRVRDFRSDRLAKVLTGDTPTPLKDGPRLVVHVVPTQAALGLVNVDPVPYSRGTPYLPTIGRDGGVAATLNFDGAFAAISYGNEKSIKYTQLFRHGYFEAVWVLEPFGNVPGPLLPGVAYEEYVNRFLVQVRAELKRLGLRQDVAVFLSLLGADKVLFAGFSEYGYGSSHYRFDRKDLLLPDVLIPEEVTPGAGMKPTYDLMCQSAGLAGSANYGPDGEWKARQ
ncbi:MAG: AlbA family DNA-binding domain-containing protein [Hydrogenophaga sp.]|uniref:AlbA family DNA-binding domain-containing protein n=1 Tax=Hydrogenophaga sp. TaxID=1904254 RepID=UPI004035C018